MKNLLARLRALAGVLAPVRKLAGSALGGATGVGVAAVLDGVGWHLPPSLDATLALALAALGTYLAPANAPKPAPPAAPAAPVTPPAA